MNQVQIYTILMNHNFGDQEAKSFVEALKEDSEVATKLDIQSVKAEIQNLEIRVMKEIIKMHELINGQTNKILGGVAVMIAIAGFILRVGR
jgi:hypothetical protein